MTIIALQILCGWLRQVYFALVLNRLDIFILVDFRGF